MIAACWIVKDGVDVLAGSIASVRPFVDECCVLDTGSTDGTLELLEELAGQPGAPIRVERGDWTGDYADARARTFAIASPGVDWLLWLDDDDIVYGGATLRRLDELPTTTTHVYAVHVAGFFTGDAAQPLEVHRGFSVRLTRPGACAWSSSVHEQLAPPVEDELACAFVVPAALRVVHPPTPVGKHDAAVLAAAIDADPGSLLGGPYAASACLRTGDLVGAEERIRAYLTVTAGRFSLMRLDMLLTLASIRRGRGDGRPAVEALLDQRNDELDEWCRRLAAGELRGFESLGPNVGAAVVAWQSPAGDERVFLAPEDLR